MNPKAKLFLRVLLFLALLFFASKPYNFFCNLTNKCQPFYLAYLLPKKEGKTPIVINFEVTNYRENLEFEVLAPVLKTVANRRNVATYRAKNTSKKTIKFTPQLIFEPEDISDYITRYQCLCEHSYSIKPGEEIKLRMIFSIDEGFDDELETYDRTLKIRYKI